MVRVYNKDTSTISPGRGLKLDSSLAELKHGDKIRVRHVDSNYVQELIVKGSSEYQLYIQFDDYQVQSRWLRGLLEVDPIKG